MRKIMKNVNVMVTMLMAMFCLFGCGIGKTEIKTDSTYQVVFEGYNGYGTASLSGEYDWSETINWMELGDDYMESMQIMSNVYSAIEYSLSETEGLSNGDKIELSIKANNEVLNTYGFSAKDKKVTVEVTGLKEQENINPFDYVEVTYTGTAPYLDANAVLNNFPLNGFYVEVANGEYLDCGDVVTVNLKRYSDDDMQSYSEMNGYHLTNLSMDYTVSDTKRFVLDVNEINDDVLAEMNAACSALIAKDVAGWHSNNDSKYSQYREFVNNTYDTCYLLTYKKDLDPYAGVFDDYINHIILVHKISTVDEGEVFEYYYAIKYDNVRMLPDGTWDIDYEDCKVNSNSFEHGTYMYHYWGGQSDYTEYCKGYETLEKLEADFFPYDVEEYDVTKK